MVKLMNQLAHSVLFFAIFEFTYVRGDENGTTVDRKAMCEFFSIITTSF